MVTLVQSNGFLTLLQRKLQTLLVQCQNMVERLQWEIFSEHEDVEGFETEGEF